MSLDANDRARLALAALAHELRDSRHFRCSRTGAYDVVGEWLAGGPMVRHDTAFYVARDLWRHVFKGPQPKKVFSGARARFSVNGTPVGYAVTSGAESIEYEEIPVLQPYPDEHVPVGFAVRSKP